MVTTLPLPPVDCVPRTKPLPVMFVITSMPVGGAETLLVNLIRGMDRARFAPELCCLKSLGPLGEILSKEIPTFSNMIANKWDVRVLGRMTRLLRERNAAAVVTVGAGDKMFWGRLAAWRAGVPVVLSAIHSTGWPDTIGRLNRLLTPITDGFIGVAAAHGRHLVDEEGFPLHKVRVIANGVDTKRFHPTNEGCQVRREFGLAPTAPVAGIVAALRTEKNHACFLQAAAKVRSAVPQARFLVVGDGPERAALETLTSKLHLEDAIHFLGSRHDVPELLAAMDVFVLTSQMEASPVSILEAMATGKPVIAPRVGSIADSVCDGETGFLTTPGDANEVAGRLVEIFAEPERAQRMGEAGRKVVERRWSLETMVQGYERLIDEIYHRKSSGQP